jgi:hypothetical protein
MADLIYTGQMRLHFHKHGAAPFVWCVSVADSWEVVVRDIVVRGADVFSVYAPKPTPDDEDGKPSAWFTCFGRLTVDEFGIATIEPVHEPREVVR